MDKLYYMISNGQQVGPFSVSQLLANGLTADTMVWAEGMSGWEPAGNVPALSELLLNNPTYGPNYQTQQPVSPQPMQYGSYQPQNNMAKPYYNWMTWAIVGTILGFLFSCIGAIFGIIGIVNSNKANTAYNYGDYVTADSANSTAKTMTIIALVLGGLGLVVSILFLVGVVASPFAAIYDF